MSRTALVVSGGGSKGAFAVGVIDYLTRHWSLKFDIVAGTSTGALIAPLAVLDDVETLIDVYTSVTTGDILSRRRTADVVGGASSVFSTAPLEQLIGRILTQERADALLSDTERRMFLVATCLQTKEAMHFYTGPRPLRWAGLNLTKLESRHEMMLAMLASANQPVLMPPVRIPSGGDPVRQYVDGGVREIAPLRVAIDSGATDLYAVVLSPEEHEPAEKRFASAFEILPRAIGIFTEEIADNDVRTAEAVNDGVRFVERLSGILEDEHGLDTEDVAAALEAAGNPFAGQKLVNLRVIRPAKELPLDGLEFDPDLMTEMVQMGRQRAEELLGPPPGP